MSAQAVPSPPTVAPKTALALDADMVHYYADRIETAVILLDDVLGEMFTDKEEANLVFRDALLLFLREASGRLESGAAGALKGKKSTSWTVEKPA